MIKHKVKIGDSVTDKWLYITVTVTKIFHSFVIGHSSDSDYDRIVNIKDMKEATNG